MIYEWIRHMDFGFSESFGLFALLPIMIWWYMTNNNRDQARIKVSTVRSFTVRSWKNRFRHWPFIFRLLAITALIFALARPQKRNDQQQTEGEGIDIVLCMDVSGSMGSRDILPSRMEVAKQVAEEFDRTGYFFRGKFYTVSGDYRPEYTDYPDSTPREPAVFERWNGDW